jgi:hypothetical protein
MRRRNQPKKDRISNTGAPCATLPAGLESKQRIILCNVVAHAPGVGQPLHAGVETLCRWPPEVTRDLLPRASVLDAQAAFLVSKLIHSRSTEATLPAASRHGSYVNYTSLYPSRVDPVGSHMCISVFRVRGRALANPPGKGRT